MGDNIPAILRTQVRQLDHNQCAYCQTPEFLTVTTFEIDHIIPTSAGGVTAVDNLCLACPACNRHKSTRQSAFDSASGEVVPLFNPRKQMWSEHFSWNLETYRLQGLTPVSYTHLTLPTKRIV